MDSSRKNYLRSDERLKKRRNARLISLFFWLIFFALLSVGFYFGVRLPMITINSIRVEGAHDVSIDAIRDSAMHSLSGTKYFFIPRNSIFFYSHDEVEKAVVSLDPRIHSVDAHFNSFSSITVAVEERSPQSLWCGATNKDAQKCYFMDNEANIFKEAPDLISGQLFRFFGTTTSLVSTSTLPMSFMDAKIYQEFLKVMNQYSKLGLPIIGLSTNDDPEIISVLLEPNWSVMLTKGDDYNMALGRVVKLVNDPTFQDKTKHSTSSIQYIDARLSNKLFFKIDSAGIATSTGSKVGTSTASTTKRR